MSSQHQEIRNTEGDHIANIPDEIVVAAIARAVSEDRDHRRFSSRISYTLLFFGMGLVLFLFYFNLHKTQEEIKQRRTQSCASFESAHLQEVNQLRNTYHYLEQLPPEEQRLTINKFVIRRLPQLEKAAMSDQDQVGVLVPLYCDQPGVGLPEPDPVVPDRPEAVDRLIHSLLPQSPDQPFDKGVPGHKP